MYVKRRNVCLFSNCTGVGEVLLRIGRKFDALYSKRAFVHWYVGDGRQEGEFMEEREGLQDIALQYREAAVCMLPEEECFE